jgi:hypothetical protein
MVHGQMSSGHKSQRAYFKWSLVLQVWLELIAESQLALGQCIVPLARADASLGIVVLRLGRVHVFQADSLRM